MGFQFRRDFLLTFGGADDDAIVLESLFVVHEVADGNSARTEEAMAASGATGGDAGDGEFQRLAIEYGDDPADGTNEPSTIEAGPGHGARPREIVDGTGEDAVQDLLRGSAEPDLFGRDVLALGRLNQIKITDVDALLLGEALGGACRRADGIVGHGLRRTGYFGLDVRLLGAKPADAGGQAARRAECLYRNTIKETFGRQQLLDIGAELSFRFWKHDGRNLFAADFEEQFDALFYCRRLHAPTSRWDAGPAICER